MKVINAQCSLKRNGDERNAAFSDETFVCVCIATDETLLLLTNICVPSRADFIGLNSKCQAAVISVFEIQLPDFKNAISGPQGGILVPPARL